MATPPDRKEVKEALSKMQYEKSPGPNGIATNRSIQEPTWNQLQYANGYGTEVLE